MLLSRHVAADKELVDSYVRNANLADDPDSFDFFNYHPFAEVRASTKIENGNRY